MGRFVVVRWNRIEDELLGLVRAAKLRQRLGCATNVSSQKICLGNFRFWKVLLKDISHVWEDLLI